MSRIDYRWGDDKVDVTRKYANELVALAPDVILALSSGAVAPLLEAGRTVPIVFAGVADPVAAGYVETLARPGGNVTGFTIYEYSIGGKWLELLKEIAPRVTRAAVLREAGIAAGPGLFGAIQALAPSLGLELRLVNVQDRGEIERAITAFGQLPNGGVIATGSPRQTAHRELIIGLAASIGCLRSTMPAFSPLPVGSSHTVRIFSTSPGARPAMSTAFSRVRSRPTCRCKHRPSTSW